MRFKQGEEKRKLASDRARKFTGFGGGPEVTTRVKFAAHLRDHVAEAAMPLEIFFYACVLDGFLFFYFSGFIIFPFFLFSFLLSSVTKSGRRKWKKKMRGIGSVSKTQSTGMNNTERKKK